MTETVKRASPAPYPRLLGDVGGTHIRLGCVVGPEAGLVEVTTFRWEDVRDLEFAVRAYLQRAEVPRARACALSIAAPVVGDEVTLTNRGWTFSVSGLRGTLDLECLHVLNDFAALAHAVPLLTAHEMRQVGSGTAAPEAPIAVLGAGTGLGVSASVPAPTGRYALPSEGGHATLCSSSADEDRVVAVLRDWFGHVSFERVLSGDGIVNLYRVQCAIANVAPAPHDAATISNLAARSLDERCVAAMDQFFAFLGSFAGNLALTLGARGGVFLGGGIVPQLVEQLESSTFRQRFEGKGRFRSYLERVPTKVIVDPTTAALRGANQALNEL